jgi:hypothetical protein
VLLLGRPRGLRTPGAAGPTRGGPLSSELETPPQKVLARFRDHWGCSTENIPELVGWLVGGGGGRAVGGGGMLAKPAHLLEQQLDGRDSTW